MHPSTGYTRPIGARQTLRRPARAGLEALLLLGIPAAVVGAAYLWLYASKRYSFPVGYDTPKYLWRSSLVGAKGLRALHGAAPPPFRSNPDRPGFPVLVDAIRSLLHVSIGSVVIVLPAVMASVVGLAAAALARFGLREARWTAPVFIVAVGASANVSRMAGPGYNDNLVLAAVAVAAAAAALGAADEHRGGWWQAAGAAMLLAGSVLIHWIFALVLAGVLGVVALLSIPASLRARRAGSGLLATPSGRLAAILAGAAAAGGVGLLALGTEPNAPKLPRQSFELKLGGDVPKYAFWVTGPLAAVGVVSAWLRSRGAGWPEVAEGAVEAAGAEDAEGAADPAARRGVWLVLVWAGLGAAGVVLLAAGASLPAHRFLAFAMGIPMLFGCALAAIGRLVARGGGRPAKWVAIALVLIGLAAITMIAEGAWSGTHPWISPAQAFQSSVAGRYLQVVGGDAPIVFIVDLGGSSPLSSTSEAFHVIRTELPPEVIPRTLIYLGTPDDFLAGRPTLRPEPATFDQASLQHWPSVRAVLDRNPIALMVPAFQSGFDAAVGAHPEWRIAPTLAIVQGPRPTGPYPPLAAVPSPLSPVRLALLWAAFLGMLAVTGSGWSAAMVAPGLLERAAMAPAFGIVALVLVGLLADRAGIRPSGAGGIGIVAAAALLGWVLAALRRGVAAGAAGT